MRVGDNNIRKGTHHARKQERAVERLKDIFLTFSNGICVVFSIMSSFNVCLEFCKSFHLQHMWDNQV